MIRRTHKNKKRILRRVNSLTSKIAYEYSKKNPNKAKIARLATQAGNALRRVKRKK